LEGAGHSTDPTDWNPILIREYVVSLQDSELSGWTVTNRVQSVLAFLRWLHEEGLTDTDISKRVKKPQPPDTQRHPLTDEEMRRLIKASKANARDAAIVAVLYDTGIRATELCTITLDDVIADQNLLKIEGRDARSASFPIHSKQTNSSIATC
jgi:site-specific recombinase XerD